MPVFSKKSALAEEELTPLEKEVVDIYNSLSDQTNPLIRHMAEKYAAVFQKLAYSVFMNMPESRWPKEIKEPRYPDIRDMLLTGVAFGYILRAREKAKK